MTIYHSVRSPRALLNHLLKPCPRYIKIVQASAVFGNNDSEAIF